MVIRAGIVGNPVPEPPHFANTSGLWWFIGDRDRRSEGRFYADERFWQTSSLYFTMEDGFVKAESTNLPMVNTLMVAQYFASNPDFCSAELRNVKTAMSGRESYGDDALGYVQLKRVQNTCELIRIRLTEPIILYSV
ncbi:hypothetical protein HW555_006069 [Spodoptera exigua]|uniref:Uncharacterized protein n=1 Tax=Spodoptera exigua TaxID=7107 RepID=A0A835L3X1_SPOEX|nr:hypothetical protein HW555_006069 [Spodoptera exigua]